MPGKRGWDEADKWMCVLLLPWQTVRTRVGRKLSDIVMQRVVDGEPEYRTPKEAECKEIWDCSQW